MGFSDERGCVQAARRCEYVAVARKLLACQHGPPKGTNPKRKGEEPTSISFLGFRLAQKLLVRSTEKRLADDTRKPMASFLFFKMRHMMVVFDWSKKMIKAIEPGKCSVEIK